MQSVQRNVMRVCARSLCAFCVLILAACGEPEPKLPSPLNYPAYVRASADALCQRLNHCTAKIVRTLSPGLQNRISVKSCVAAATADLDRKLAVHTPEMIQYSIVCYEAMVSAPCNQLGLMAYIHPACSRLRQISNDRFRVFPVSAPPDFEL